MARSRGKPEESTQAPKDTLEEPLEESETDSETVSEPKPEPAKTQKQWDFSEARRANLAKAREKAKLLREQLKIANPPTIKAKKKCKMEKKLEELSAKPIVEDMPEPKPSDVWLRQAEQPVPKSSFVRQGKFLYLVD